MSVRNTLGKNQKWVIFSSIALIAVCVVFIAKQLHSGSNSDLPPLPDQAFYTVDDGATLFKDSLYKIPPIDHNGQRAVRAHAYTVDGGKHQWVQYLEKFSDADQKILESGKRGNGPVPIPLVKRPGKGEWVPIGSESGRQVILATPPPGSGSGEALPVVP